MCYTCVCALCLCYICAMGVLCICVCAMGVLCICVCAMCLCYICAMGVLCICVCAMCLCYMLALCVCTRSCVKGFIPFESHFGLFTVRYFEGKHRWPFGIPASASQSSLKHHRQQQPQRPIER